MNRRTPFQPVVRAPIPVVRSSLRVPVLSRSYWKTTDLKAIYITSRLCVVTIEMRTPGKVAWLCREELEKDWCF